MSPEIPLNGLSQRITGGGPRARHPVCGHRRAEAGVDVHHDHPRRAGGEHREQRRDPLQRRAVADRRRHRDRPDSPRARRRRWATPPPCRRRRSPHRRAASTSVSASNRCNPATPTSAQLVDVPARGPSRPPRPPQPPERPTCPPRPRRPGTPRRGAGRQDEQPGRRVVLPRRTRPLPRRAALGVVEAGDQHRPAVRSPATPAPRRRSAPAVFPGPVDDLGQAQPRLPVDVGPRVAEVGESRRERARSRDRRQAEHHVHPPAGEALQIERAERESRGPHRRVQLGAHGGARGISATGTSTRATEPSPCDRTRQTGKPSARTASSACSMRSTISTVTGSP